MGYESAPSTIKLATNCLLCGQPLRDPLSVETGIGPICRAKHGYATQGNEATRAEVSKLIHAAAAAGLTAVQIYEYADKIEALGFSGVADKVRTRFARSYEWETGAASKAMPLIIKCVEDYNFRGTRQPCILLHTPYSKKGTKEFNDELKLLINGADRTGEKIGNEFYWVIKATRKPELWSLLLAHFDGRMVHGPKGSFIIGESEHSEEAEETAASIVEAINNATSMEEVVASIIAPTPTSKVEEVSPVVVVADTTSTSTPAPTPMVDEVVLKRCRMGAGKAVHLIKVHANGDYGWPLCGQPAKMSTRVNSVGTEGAVTCNHCRKAAAEIRGAEQPTLSAHIPAPAPAPAPVPEVAVEEIKAEEIKANDLSGYNDEQLAALVVSLRAELQRRGHTDSWGDLDD